MRKPDASRHNPDPEYLRELIEASGLSQRQAAVRLGVNERTMRHWLAGKSVCPYTAQYCLEALAK